MNGDEVRRLLLPTAAWGYDPAAVEELLDRVAAELDAARKDPAARKPGG